jgi:hypothetical protein
MIARRKFTGIVKGVPKTFRPGDKITEAEAKELGLAEKPELAAKAAKD